MFDYQRTQPGTLLRVVLGACVLVFAALAASLMSSGDQEGLYLGVAAALFVLLLALFHSLTVRVSADAIELAFGIGVIRKSFDVADIEAAEIVRNHWYNGWGIKKIRGGWLYNVSGFDAVEIRLKNGKKSRIGTDEPKELLAAIESRIVSAR